MSEAKTERKTGSMDMVTLKKRIKEAMGDAHLDMMADIDRLRNALRVFELAADEAESQSIDHGSLNWGSIFSVLGELTAGLEKRADEWFDAVVKEMGAETCSAHDNKEAAHGK